MKDKQKTYRERAENTERAVRNAPTKEDAIEMIQTNFRSLISEVLDEVRLERISVQEMEEQGIPQSLTPNGDKVRGYELAWRRQAAKIAEIKKGLK